MNYTHSSNVRVVYYLIAVNFAVATQQGVSVNSLVVLVVRKPNVWR